MSLEAPRMMPKFLWRWMLLQIKMLLSYSGQRVRSSNFDNRNTEEPNWKMHWGIGNHITRCWYYVDEDKGFQSPITNKRPENGFHWFVFVELYTQSLRKRKGRRFILVDTLALSKSQIMTTCLAHLPFPALFSDDCGHSFVSSSDWFKRLIASILIG